MIERINVVGDRYPCALLIDVSGQDDINEEVFKEKIDIGAKIISDWLFRNLPKPMTKIISQNLK